MVTMINGSSLTPAMQEEAKRRFVHRYTREHIPDWCRAGWLDGAGKHHHYAVQFASDADWLANSEFPITKGGRFSERERYCISHPTWPDNPELRKAS